MNRSFNLALTLSTLTLVSCRENTGPLSPADTQDGAVPSLAQVGNSWVARARLLTARIDHSAGVMNNSAGQPILYIFGGNDPIEEFPVETIEAYNYVTNRWTTKTPRLKAFAMNGVGVIGGRLYLSGGALNNGDGFSALRTRYAYDPVTDLLTRRADTPRPSTGGVTGVIKGKLYLLIGGGGDSGDPTSRRFYRYDPTTNRWTALRSCPHVHRDGAGAVSKGRFYVAGGFDGTGLTADLDVYDPATNRWKTLAPLPDRRANAAGVALRGKLYVIGGGGSAGDRKVYAYDPATDSWKSRASLPTGRHSLAAAPLVTPTGNPKILAVGGFNFSDSTSASVNELYTP